MDKRKIKVIHVSKETQEKWAEEHNRKLECLKKHGILSESQVSYLLDYITNLQEENEKLKAYINYEKQQTKVKGRRIYGDNREELQQRIDKSIEYIMTNLISEWDIENGGNVSGSDLSVDAITPILDILLGSDEE